MYATDFLDLDVICYLCNAMTYPLSKYEMVPEVAANNNNIQEWSVVVITPPPIFCRRVAFALTTAEVSEAILFFTRLLWLSASNELRRDLDEALSG
jgi:hypothetical protein